MSLPFYDTIQVAVVREPRDPQIVTIVESVRGAGVSPSGAPFEPAMVLHVNSVSSYSVLHAFGYFPEVRLVDQTGRLVEIGVEYPDVSHVYLEFPTPFTGTVILS